MKIVPALEILLKKDKHRKLIPELQYHGANNFVHVGEISHGCKSCLLGAPSNIHQKVVFGTKCNMDCPMCYKRFDQKEAEQMDQSRIRSTLINLYNNVMDLNFKPLSASYVSDGETLFYLDDIEEHCSLLNKVEKRHNYSIYKHIYTNGTIITPKILDRLEAANITEIRFHITASFYPYGSKEAQPNIDKIIKNMYEAKKRGFIVTVEEPALPKHKDVLMSLLPIFEDLKLDHFNLTEIDVTAGNKYKLEQLYPGSTIYKITSYLMYDDGMTYDIMKEVIDKNYSFSVFECSSRIIPAMQEIFYNEIEGLTRNF